MERAPFPMARGNVRTQLLRARQERHFSQEEVAAQIQVSKVTVHRWEKEGDIPQPFHLRALCQLYGKTAPELGFPMQPPVFLEVTVDGQTVNPAAFQGPEEPALTTFRQQHLLARLMRMIWSWSPGDARYQMLQALLLAELEDNAMHDEMSRRDALRFLALVPVDLFGLSHAGAVFQRAFSYDDILKHCAAGLAACWQLRKGKELAFANAVLATYLPTLQAIAQTAPPAQQKVAADLLAQCFLLKAPLAWNLTTPHDAIGYAKQAETYATLAGSRLLQITALRTTAAAFCYAKQWKPALRAAEKAQYLLEQKEVASSGQPLQEPVPQLVCSYVYAGLATYRAYDGQKEATLRALKKAHQAFFEQPIDEPVPLWCDHNIGNLLSNDGEAYQHLNMYHESISSLERIHMQYAQDTTVSLTSRLAAMLRQVAVEASRDDQLRDMQWCIDRWTQGMEGAKALQSQHHFEEAVQAYAAMRAAWPAEKQVKDLRDLIVHW